MLVELNRDRQKLKVPFSLPTSGSVARVGQYSWTVWVSCTAASPSPCFFPQEWFETARIEKDNDQRETRQTRNKKKTAAPNDSGDNGDGRGDSGEGSYVGPIFNAELKAGEIDSDLLLVCC